MHLVVTALFAFRASSSLIVALFVADLPWSAAVIAKKAKPSASVSTSAHRRDNSSLPHILMVLADDLGYHDVGFMGGGIATPVIDRLAREGTILSNYYVQLTCSPTRATIMTGRHSSNHGVLTPFQSDKPTGLPENEVLLPEALRALGYSTHAVGKWHLGFYKETLTPTFRGFETFYGFYGLGEDYIDHIDIGVYDFRSEVGPNCGRNCSIVVDVRGEYGTTLFTRRSKDLIQMHDPAVPLFIYLAWQAVHAPKCCFCDGVSTISAESPRDPCFACMLMEADKGLGEIISVLDHKQMLKDTIIIFSTDNGGAVSTNSLADDDVGSSNFPLRGGKHTIFEGGTRGIGLLWFGGSVAGSGSSRLPRVYDYVMGCVDWLPTILTAIGVKHLPTALEGLDGRVGMAIDGVSHFQEILSIGQGFKPLRPRTSLFLGASLHGTNNTLPGLAMRNGNWKLIVGEPCGLQHGFGWSLKNGSDLLSEIAWPGFNEKTTLLFDLSVDSQERYNRAQDQPHVVNEILLLLEPHMQSPYIRRTANVRVDEYPLGTAINGSLGPWVF
eukprot:TRINITY_DN4920_c1_g1_i1.p1 TRINITY_DN4920_c1_g1~~TRINITY_DN4920_c1_g1_i1.p1  ORF type:complete len:554 (-),score=62.61 TRINITY_DN4920_c1_g1_i1:183-1844(-)